MNELKRCDCGEPTYSCECSLCSSESVRKSPVAPEAIKATGTAVQESAPAELPIKTWQERLREKFPETADRNLFTVGHIEHAMEAEIADLRAALSAAPASPQPVVKVLEEIQELQAEIMRVTAANAILIQRIVNGCTAIEVGAMADNDKSPSDYKQGIAKGASDCLKFIQEQRKRAASTPTTLTEKKG